MWLFFIAGGLVKQKRIDRNCLDCVSLPLEAVQKKLSNISSILLLIFLVGCEEQSHFEDSPVNATSNDVMALEKEKVNDRSLSEEPELPFTVDELREITGEPDRIEGVSWYFTGGKLFPYLRIIQPTTKSVSFSLENDPYNESALTAIFTSELFTISESEQLLDFVAFAKGQLRDDSTSKGEKAIGRYTANYYRSLGGTKQVRLNAKME
jgi:hypothetical protein